MTRTETIEWEGGEVTARLAGGGDTGVLLAHGAGTDQDHPFMVLLRDGLAEAGHTVMTFNYPRLGVVGWCTPQNQDHKS